MEEQIYELMAQAEDLQTHAAELQKQAQEAFSALDRATNRIDKEMRSKASFWAVGISLTLIAVGMLVAVGIKYVVEWTTDDLRAEASALKDESARLRSDIAEMEETAKNLESKTWRIELVTYNDGQRGIRIPKDMEFDRITSDSTKKDVVLVKRKGK